MTKIRQLLTNWPKGALRLSKELEQIGIGRQLLATYKESGWIESFDHGVYQLARDDVDWTGAVYAIQQIPGFTLHPGGKTALALKGFSHYVGTGNEKRFLYMSPATTNFRWLEKFEQVEKVQTILFNYLRKDYFAMYSTGRFSISVSVPELACLEMLYLVPAVQSFDEAAKIMEMLYSLRPELMQSLLQECRSIKVVRLLLFFADYFDHPWLKKLDQSKFNKGNGSRVIVHNGIHSNKFQITVPREYGSRTI